MSESEISSNSLLVVDGIETNINIRDLNTRNLVINKIKEKTERISSTPTPKNKIKKRKAKGGGLWSYATTDYFEDFLNVEFPGWSFMLKDYKINGSGINQFIVAHVELYVNDEGVPRKISDVGGSEVKFYGKKNEREGDILDLPNDVKAATSDGLKRCCYRLGMARDLKTDPSDLTITEEQQGVLKDLLEFAQLKTIDTINKIVDKNINQANFETFVKEKIVPIIKNKWPDKYNKLPSKYKTIGE